VADVLVDSNVLLDVVTEDPAWFTWSSRQLEELAEQHTLVINPVIRHYGSSARGPLDRTSAVDAVARGSGAV
jgi:hypothetical protein